jgi:hypothetical protein
MGRRPKPLTGPDDPRHGTMAGYKRGCCCFDCRCANTDRVLVQNAQRRARLNAGLASPAHGRYTTYSNWGCRCQPCRDAWAAYWRDMPRPPRATNRRTGPRRRP